MGITIRQKPPRSGVWWVFLRHKGKRLSKKIGSHKLAMQVKGQLEEKLALGALGLLDDTPERPTFTQYVDGWDTPDGYRLGWMETAKLSRKYSTRIHYERMIKNHLKPHFGSKRLDQITARQIHDFAIVLLHKGLRSKTVKNIKNCLSAILQHACTPDAYLSANPAHGVQVPKPENERPKREPSPFTWEDRETIEKLFEEDYPEHYALVVTGFRAGLRIGELLALQIGDIDFKNRVLFVKRSTTMGRTTTPKTKSSSRPVRMSSHLIDTLKKQRKKTKEETLKKGWKEVPDLLFTIDGKPIDYYRFIMRIWNKAIEKSGLLRRTPHDMRHTYATLRLSKGDSLAEVSKEMGHSSPEITYRTYYHWLPSESRSNIDELDNQQAPNGTPMAPKKKRTT